jgi:hypothetical protein
MSGGKRGEGGGGEAFEGTGVVKQTGRGLDAVPLVLIDGTGGSCSREPGRGTVTGHGGTGWYLLNQSTNKRPGTGPVWRVKWGTFRGSH